MKYVVGDVHGEITKLRQLISFILLIDRNPEFIFIGDYLDKGEDPAAVLNYLGNLSRNYQCIFLMGNHEFMWLSHSDNNDVSDYLLKYGGVATINSLHVKTVAEGRDKLLADFGDFFSMLVPFWKSEQYVAVHSGISPGNYSLELDLIPLEQFLFNRYDFISYESKYLDTYQVIFGHTGFFNPYVTPYKIGIDTAACFLENQPLTAFCTDTKTFYNSHQVSCESEAFQSNICPNIIRTKPWRYD